MPRINAVSFRQYPSIESICRAVFEAGFDSLELSRPLFYDQLVTPGTRQRFADWATELGLSPYGFDCWVEVDLYSAFDETLSEFQKAVDWANDLNLGMLISHDPWQQVNADRGPAECLKVNIELFRRVADACEEQQLRLVRGTDRRVRYRHPLDPRVGRRGACQRLRQHVEGRVAVHLERHRVRNHALERPGCWRVTASGGRRGERACCDASEFGHGSVPFEACSLFEA